MRWLRILGWLVGLWDCRVEETLLSFKGRGPSQVELLSTVPLDLKPEPPKAPKPPFLQAFVSRCHAPQEVLGPGCKVPSFR